MADKKIRIAVVGAGWAGQAHVKFYKDLPFVEIVGWADVAPGKAATAAASAGIPADRVFTDFRQMIDRVVPDAVSVCTFNMGHREPTIYALEAGKHVLLEKPMAATLDDAAAIMRAWEKTDRILMVAFQPDFSAENLAAKQIVDTGMLGDIYYSEAVTHRRFGIPGGNFVKKATAGFGTLVDTGVYAIHNNLWLMGDPKPIAVSAITGNPLAKAYKGIRQTFGGPWSAEEFEVEEFAFAFVRFENGAAMIVKSTWAAHADSIGRTFFLGTKAGLALDPLEVFQNQSVGEFNMTMTPKNIAKEESSAAWGLKMRRFAEAVRDGLPSPIDPRGVYLVNVIMDGVIRSAAEKREVAVNASYALVGARA